MNRRNFLSAALVGLTAKADRAIQGSYVNESFPTGHKIRDHKAFPSTAEIVRIPAVIVGGGIAGLSAAWWLDKKGFRDFVLLEMEPDAGGNSRWGQNAISRYPWAAHYVPVPQSESVYVRELFTELGIADNGGWKEEMLCFSLKERLFVEGRWQEGIEPDSVLTRTDREQFRRFAERIAEFRASAAFTIPMELGSSTNENHAELDALSFSDWLTREGYSSRYLRWYTDYACRDDFGALARDTSAWAGIHYFASRSKEEIGPITAPEGNGWIVRRLLAKLHQYVRTSCPVFHIGRSGTGWLVHTPQLNYRVDSIIFAAPTFLAGYMIDGFAKTENLVYSPWFTANLTLDQMPHEQTGAELAWDNVLFHSKSLGYVDATHMSLRTHIDRTVWTYYWSLAEYGPRQARQILLDRSWNDWKEIILQDLEQAHPDIRQCITRIDMMRLGHAMARPTPGFLQSKERRRWIKGEPGIHFANSDLSGFSIFEEAQYRGIRAAENVLRRHSLVRGGIAKKVRWA